MDYLSLQDLYILSKTWLYIIDLPIFLLASVKKVFLRIIVFKNYLLKSHSHTYTTSILHFIEIQWFYLDIIQEEYNGYESHFTPPPWENNVEFENAISDPDEKLNR